ncbi:4-hydroxy-tetrahydrodipicolinate synthase [Muricauda sp. SCSIO 64092]|uniref:4-hydroxy-tetrahydrodipicolinate synthase n=1 Tax=Allomuricauda sp. SCSIO 64092 TaxID=2908842 RepID=UPI001FF26C6B|nr:4-hydroxy-tetrahydrodipicolinate synthase [Muricauda sp. SCSIO 64092]UOY06932.1 4-hydroxy-tetrahydrodipicolinate synthase [Muricauda sp. SCSIO 64092]
MESLVGTGVALVTPFRTDLSIDTKALENLVEHCISGGVDYLVALGTTAESVTLTKEEKRLVMQTISLANAGRLPLVVGVGGNNTMAVVKELQTLDFMDFEAILSVSPAYNKPTQEGIYQHFREISKASPLPIIVYNVPSRTGSNMLPGTTIRLAKDFKNIVAIKEACADQIQIDQLMQQKPDGFHIISGDDFTALSTVLAGGSGVISVLGQGLPEAFSRMISLGLQGDSERAYGIHQTLLDGMHLIFEEGNPAGIKTVLEYFGLGGSQVRLPLVSASTALKSKINRFLGQLQHVNA